MADLAMSMEDCDQPVIVRTLRSGHMVAKSATDAGSTLEER